MVIFLEKNCHFQILITFLLNKKLIRFQCLLNDDVIVTFRAEVKRSEYKC